jgi:hypothetical protein
MLLLVQLQLAALCIKGQLNCLFFLCRRLYAAAVRPQHASGQGPAQLQHAVWQQV